MPKLKVLYFIDSSKPTNYDRQRAAYSGQAVSFRNLANIEPDSPAEPCDAVMGVVIPAQYAAKPVYGS